MDTAQEVRPAIESLKEGTRIRLIQNVEVTLSKRSSQWALRGALGTVRVLGSAKFVQLDSKIVDSEIDSIVPPQGSFIVHTPRK